MSKKRKVELFEKVLNHNEICLGERKNIFLYEKKAKDFLIPSVCYRIKKLFSPNVGIEGFSSKCWVVVSQNEMCRYCEKM